MSITWLCVALSIAVVIAVVLIVVACVKCRKKGPMASITQTASDEYGISPNQFIVIHPSQPTTNLNSLRPPVSHPSPFPNRPGGGTVWQPSPYPPSEPESNPSYENPAGPESLDSDVDDAGSGYIIVIPEGQAPVINQSGTSTPSSAPDDQNDHDYVNIEKEFLTEDYLNVDRMYNQRPISATTATTDSDDDDDDETGNYVNQQPMIHS